MSSTTGLSANSTLSGDGVEDGEVDELINWIIIELDPTTSAVENDEVDSLGGGMNGKSPKDQSALHPRIQQISHTPHPNVENS